VLTLLAEEQECLWDEALPIEVRELPDDLAALDRLLADPAVLGPIVERFRREVIEERRAVLTDGRPTIAMETYVRLMVLKARYRWGYRSLMAEVSDSIHLRRFCRIRLSEPRDRRGATERDQPWTLGRCPQLGIAAVPNCAIRPKVRSLRVVHGDFNELVAPPQLGRTFTQTIRPGFADCAPTGRIRLDALACWLQDVAYADVEDAGLAESVVWVVRRTRMRVNRFPRFGERFEVTTFCSGLGRMWAERRTDVVRRGEPVADVEAVSLWVHLSPDDWRPTPLTEHEILTYGYTTPGRRVSARLRHPAPSAIERSAPWTFRATERDIAGHINNAAYWQTLEEELLGGCDPDSIDVEIEYRAPAQPGEKFVLRAGGRRWIVDGDGETHASILVVNGTVT
jgi:acyl-ACP thioesterase